MVRTAVVAVAVGIAGMVAAPAQAEVCNEVCTQSRVNSLAKILGHLSSDAGG
ncbi:MAG: hypothetical protein IRY84_17285, partial [Thermobispora bispora]|nr:hypothetical protein [Thermobispora bispora]